MNTSDEYFAAAPTENLVDQCESWFAQWGIRTYGTSLFGSSFAMYWRNVYAFFSPTLNAQDWSTSLSYLGEQGELVRMVVPNAKVLAQQFATLITKPRIHYEAVTDANSARPLEDAKLARALLNVTSQNFSFDDLNYEMAESTYVKGEVFLSCTWRKDMGKETGLSGDQIQYSGDNFVEMHDKHDVVYDWCVTNEKSRDWYLLRRAVNRYNLAEIYPEHRDAILAASSVMMERQAMPQWFGWQTFPSNDLIYLREFYHRPTAALPRGRMCYYLPGGEWLEDKENPYQELPVWPVRFQKFNQTSLGYAPFSDLLPAQEVMDAVISSIATNQAAHGVQAVIVPKRAAITVQQIQGMNYIEYETDDAGRPLKPEPLNLTNTPAELFTFVENLRGYQSDLSSINATLRGQPPPNVTSGAMAATLSANSLELMSNAQKVIKGAFEWLGNRTIRNYKAFGLEPQVIEIVGEGNIGYAKEFVGNRDLVNIRRVQARLDNPLLSSTAGRLSLAQEMMPLLQSGDMKMAAKFAQIVNGAPLDVLFDEDFSLQQAVDMEIEAFLEGKPIIPAVTDYAPAYIQAYKKLLSSPQVRAQSEMLLQILNIINARIFNWQNLDPMFKEAVFNIPSPQPAGPMPQGGGQSPQPAPGQAPSAPSTPAQPLVAQPEIGV